MIKKYDEFINEGTNISDDNQNLITLNSISDIEQQKFGKALDREIRRLLGFYLSNEMNQTLKQMIGELEKGTKISDMPDNIKETILLISEQLRKNPGKDTIPERYKKNGINIGISRPVLIEYLKKAISIPPGPLSLSRLSNEFCK